MSPRLSILSAAALTLLAACADPSAPLAPPTARSADVVQATPTPGAGCTFETGTTTCLTFATHEETSTHVAYKGCLYGPTGIPSAAELTSRDTYLVVEETVTLQHGLEGSVYESSTYEVSRTVVSSTIIGYECLPPSA